MTKRILIIGGYGNFGSYIARRLSREQGITVIIAGRDSQKAKALADTLGTEWAELDITRNLDGVLSAITPDIVIHTSGPFQGQGYDVAQSCIRNHVHYIDLADGRDFVTGISALDAAAKKAGVMIVTGASSVPALTSAIIDAHLHEFHNLDTIRYAIATAQKTNRGLATTKAVLGYAGRPFITLINGVRTKIYGWQDFHVRKFDGLGWRCLGNCDIPDLSLFPSRYPTLKTIRFYAGLELPFIHLALWMMTWLVRWRLLPNLARFASAFLKISFLFDRLGTDKSAFYMDMSGTSMDGSPQTISFHLLAEHGDGPNIPCTPAIAMALKLAKTPSAGATPCVGLLTLDDILAELKPLHITWTTRRSHHVRT